MRKHLIVAAIVSLLVAAAMTSSFAKDIDLQGTWQFTLVVPESSHQYSGTIVIDGSNMAQATVKGPHGVVSEKGHVNISRQNIDLIFTSVDDSGNHGVTYQLDKFRCTSQSKDTLSCHDITAGEQVHPFVVSRSSNIP